MTTCRHVPTAFVIVMLAGVALPAEAKNAEGGTPATAQAEAVPATEQAPVTEIPQSPGKDDDADQAAEADDGQGKSADQVPAAKSKGKPVSAPAALPVNPVAAPAALPAAAPAAAPAPAPQPAEERVAGRPDTSEPVDQTGGRSGAGPGATTFAGIPPAAIETPSLASADSSAPSSQEGPGAGEPGESDTGGTPAPQRDDSVVTRTVRDVVEVVPEPVKAALALLGALAILFGGGYALAAARARRLSRQRRELMQEVGLLQAALLPPVPEKVGSVRASVAYRPSDGPGAGGDFYDALTLPGGRAAFILGDVSGHGRAALAHTAFMRYTLRAYLEAGLEPRLALQVAERAVGGQLDGDFATVIVAVHDPSDGSLTYASAGHPAPIVTGGARHEPVLAAWSPPIGWGLPTGLRQTTVPLPSGAIACLYTDGLAEATTEDGILGRARLAEIVGEAGREATAQDVLDAVAAEAMNVRDDMAACLIAPSRHVNARAFRTELLELGPSELHEGLAVRFLEECNVPAAAIDDAREEARSVVDVHGGALMIVNFGVRGSRVQVLPRNVESLQAAALRKSAPGR